MADGIPETRGMRKRYCRGFPMPAAPWFSEENIEAAMDYIPEDGDVVLCSYPKTGTTWMTYIVWGILHKGQSYPNLKDSVTTEVPFLEFQDCVQKVKELKKPRFYKHHLPLTLAKTNPRAKYLYIYRHPEDVIASYYPFSKETSGNEGDFGYFFDEFFSGDVAYGHYFDHVRSFYDKKDELDILMVSYEKLKQDARTEVLRIAEFLGREYHNALLEDEQLLETVLEKSSFDYMKKNLKLSLPAPDGGDRDVTLIREGKVGGGKNLLNEDQRRRLKEAALKKLSCTDVVGLWYPD